MKKAYLSRFQIDKPLKITDNSKENVIYDKINKYKTDQIHKKFKILP